MLKQKMPFSFTCAGRLIFIPTECQRSFIVTVTADCIKDEVVTQSEQVTGATEKGGKNGPNFFDKFLGPWSCERQPMPDGIDRFFPFHVSNCPNYTIVYFF